MGWLGINPQAKVKSSRPVKFKPTPTLFFAFCTWLGAAPQRLLHRAEDIAHAIHQNHRHKELDGGDDLDASPSISDLAGLKASGLHSYDLDGNDLNPLKLRRLRIADAEAFRLQGAL